MKIKLAIIGTLSIISLNFMMDAFAGNDEELHNRKQESDLQFVRRHNGPWFEPVGYNYIICPNRHSPCYTLTDYMRQYQVSATTIRTDLVTLAKEDNSDNRIIIERVNGDNTDVSMFSYNDVYAHLTKKHFKQALKDKK